ncbi:MAG: serine/threonine-protein kinase [Planctomycetaceae bacterium]
MPTDPNHDERLARLLEGLVEGSRGGRMPDLEAVIAENPDLASELRELWATAMIAEDFASFSGELAALDAQATLPPRSVHARPTATISLPQRIGDYELLEELGRGGMGVVFKARQLSLNRIVAFKMILRGDMASEADVARFKAEAESAARLNHPHIVPVYEVGERDGLPFFSMKYVEGTTLGKRLAEGPLPPREAAALLVPVCHAVADAHRHGLLHRDLKPSNILIDASGRPFVTDFGLAKRFNPSPADRDGDIDPTQAARITQSGAILGTPGYMAPEQAAGRRGEIGLTTDVYSLGAILYATLTGRPPFQAASPVDTVLMVLEQDPLPPRFLNPKADPDLEMIALKCLQKPPDLRYADAAALADDLQAYLANEPISARSSHFTQIISRAFRETHHAGILENWGLLWMWHSLVLLVLCLVTNAFQWMGVASRIPYLALWSVGLSVWAVIFWNLRRRSGPITFVERQIAHIWAGSMISSTLLYAVEAIMGLDVLTLSPVLAVVSGTVFLVKAGILSGWFYIQAAILFLTALVMAVLQRPDMPPVGISLFGIVSACCFFFPGLKYYRQRMGTK